MTLYAVPLFAVILFCFGCALYAAVSSRDLLDDLLPWVGYAIYHLNSPYASAEHLEKARSAKNRFMAWARPMKDNDPLPVDEYVEPEPEPIVVMQWTKPWLPMWEERVPESMVPERKTIWEDVDWELVTCMRVEDYERMKAAEFAEAEAVVYEWVYCKPINYEEDDDTSCYI